MTTFKCRSGVLVCLIVVVSAVTVPAQVKSKRAPKSEAQPVVKPVTITLVRWPYT